MSWRGNSETGGYLKSSRALLSALQQWHPNDSVPVFAPMGKVVQLVCCSGEEREGSRKIINSSVYMLIGGGKLPASPNSVRLVSTPFHALF